MRYIYDFCHFRSLQKQKSLLEGWQYRTQDPWDRICRHHTLSSLRHQWCKHESDAPRDSLDISLKAVYQQHSEWLKSKAEVLLQKESLNMQHKYSLFKGQLTPFFNIHINILRFFVLKELTNAN